MSKCRARPATKLPRHWVHRPDYDGERGPAWRQTIYYPFLHASLYGRGKVLHPVIDTPVHDNSKFGDVPILDAVVTMGEEEVGLTIFAVNRDQTEPMALECDLRGMADGFRVEEYIILEHPDIEAANSLEHPDNVLPHHNGNAVLEGGRLNALLPKLSWNVIRLVKLED